MGSPSPCQFPFRPPEAFRLGLSATPDRKYDGDGNRFIEDEIGPVIFEFGLKDAIERSILCGFDYIDLEYEFSVLARTVQP